jgi:hypothetical protein
MTICAVIDADNNLVNTIVAEPTDLAPDGCILVEIPEGYYWDGKQVTLVKNNGS